MPNLLPAITIGLATLLLLTQRDVRVALGAFFLQWASMGWLVWMSPSPAASSLSALVELVTALSTSTVMALTLFRTASTDDQIYVPGGTGVRAGRRSLRLPGSGGSRQPQDWILLWGLGTLAGVAGYGLARVNPLGVSEGDLLAFFWVVLATILMLTLDGSRSAVKLGLGLLSLLNSAFLLLYIAGSAAPSVGVLAIAALARIGAGMLASYLWLAIGERYGTLNLNALFDRREGAAVRSSSMALAVRKAGLPPDDSIVAAEEWEEDAGE